MFRTVFIFISLLQVTALYAQSAMLAGYWKGALSQDDKKFFYVMELKLKQKGNKLTGTAKYQADDSNFVKFIIEGSVNGNSFSLKDVSIIEERSSYGWFWCKKIYSGTVNNKDHILSLDAVWKNDKRNMFSKKILVQNSDVSCAPGTFRVSRVKEQTLKEIPKRVVPLKKDSTIDKIEWNKDSLFHERRVAVQNRIKVYSDTIDLHFYDNGDIDGDTISVYFNKQLIIDKQPLYINPLTVTITLNPNSENEILMFANNEGSIPPNTAILIFDTKGKRVEIPINSDLNSSGTVYLFR